MLAEKLFIRVLVTTASKVVVTVSAPHDPLPRRQCQQAVGIVGNGCDTELSSFLDQGKLR